MSILNADYAKCVELSQRVAWKLDDVFPPEQALDFGKPFMPRAMFFAHDLAFLNDDEKLRLNQIYGNSYRYLFYFVEAYIIAMAVQHAEAALYGEDDNNLRAMLRFAEEEVKHQQMFLRFGEKFEAGFDSKCDLVESPQTVAQVILSKSPMAVLLVTLHLELITQVHYVDCMRDDQDIDPLFKQLFKHHWLEESQHAKLDVLELLKLRRDATAEQIQVAIDDYFEIAAAFAGLLADQAQRDVLSLERALDRTFDDDSRQAIEAAQARAYHRAFLWSGVTNSLFLEFLAEYFPAALDRAAAAANAFA
jgi:hypothetical protein